MARAATSPITSKFRSRLLVVHGLHERLFRPSVQAQILPAGEKWVTKHRYSGFRDINARVRALPRSQRPEKGQLPRLTGRKWFGGSTSQSVVDKRIIKLSTYLQSLCRMAQNYPAVQGILVDFLDDLPSDQPRGRPAAGMEPQTALRKLSVRRWGSFNAALDSLDGEGDGEDDDEDDGRSQRTAGSTVSASTGPAARGGGGSTVLSQPSDRTMETESSVCACCMQPLESDSQVTEDARQFCSSTCALFFRATAAKGFTLKAENGSRRLVPVSRPPPAASSSGAAVSGSGSVLAVGAAAGRQPAAPADVDRRKSSSMLRGLLRSVGLQQVSGSGGRPLSSGGAERVLHSGWLLKRGGWQGGRKTWKQRWFVLTHNALYYHKRQPFSGGNTLLGVMQLGATDESGQWVPADVQRLPATEAENLSFSLSRLPAPFFFSVCTDKRQLYLCATNEGDQRKWVDNITYCSNPTAARPPGATREPQEDDRGDMEASGTARQKSVFRSMITDPAGQVQRGGLHFAKAQVVTMADLNEQKARSVPGTPGAGSVLSGPDSGPEDATQEAGSIPSEKAPVDAASLGSVHSEGLLSPQAAKAESVVSAASAHTPVLGDHDSISRQVSAGSLSSTVAGRGAAGKRSSLFTLSGAAQWEVEDDEVEMHGKLGKGQFGDVYKGRLWGTDIAVKLLVAAGLTDEVLSSLREEVAVLSSLRHPHIVLFIGCNTSCANPFIVTEYCARGSLDRLVYDSSTPLPAPLSLRFALQCAQGVAYLHSRRGDMIHRDIKCENLLLSEGWDVKVADFGLTVMKSKVKGASGNTGEEQDLAQLDGTPQFCAPEVFEGGRVTSMVDVYAFGVVLCELFHRVLPFSDAFDRWDFIDHVLEDGATPTIPVWADVPSRFMATAEAVPAATRSPLLQQAAAEVRGAAQHTRRSRAPTLAERSVSDVSSASSDDSRQGDFSVDVQRWGDDDAAYAQWVTKDCATQEASGLSIITTSAKIPALHPWRVWGPDREVGDTSAFTSANAGVGEGGTAIFLSPGTAARASVSGNGASTRASIGARGAACKAKVPETPLPAGAVDKAGGVQAAWEMDKDRPGRVSEWVSYEGDATGVIRAMIEACLHRDQDLRPAFGDLVTLLRELVALPAHDLFLCFDLPRLRETMSYADPRCQARAAREVSALCYSSMVERSVTLQLPSPAPPEPSAGTLPRFKMPVQRRSGMLASDTGRAVDGSLAPAFARILGGSRSPDAPLLLQQGTLLTAMPHLLAGIAGMMRCNDITLRTLCDLPLCASKGGIHGSVAAAATPSEAAPAAAATPSASSAQQRSSKMAAKRAARKAMDALVAQHDTVRDCVQSMVAGLQALEYCLFTWISTLHSNTQAGVRASTQCRTGELPWEAMELLVDCDMLPVRDLGRAVHALSTLAAAGRPLRKWHAMIQKLQDDGAKLPRGTSSTLLTSALEFTVSSHVQSSAARLLGTLWAVHERFRPQIERVVSNTFGAAAIAECGTGAAGQRHLAWLCDPLNSIQVGIPVKKPLNRRATVSVSALKSIKETPEEVQVVTMGAVIMDRVSRIVSGSVDTSSTARVSDTVAQFSRSVVRRFSSNSVQVVDEK